jgi:protein-disulfide isomerase
MRLAALVLTAILCCAAATGPEVDKGKILGSPTAPIRIDVYSDFECPACKTFHEQTLPLIVRDYVMAGKVYIVNREFPLNIPAHRYSREAANYATAAARLGIYQPVADALFRGQAEWSANGKFWDAIASVLSPEQQKKVQAIAKEPSVAAEVQRDVDAGMKEKISSTPTIMVTHGTQHFPIPFPVNYEFLRSLLNGFLK